MKHLTGELFGAVQVLPVPPQPAHDKYFSFIYEKVAAVLVKRAMLSHAETLYTALLLFDDILRPFGIPDIAAARSASGKHTLNATYKSTRMRAIVRATYHDANIKLYLDDTVVMNYTISRRKMRKMW